MRAVLAAATVMSSCIPYTSGFVVQTQTPPRHGGTFTARMVGGKGWENAGFLDSLGGSDEDRDEATEAYNEFHESREAFNKRQQERMGAMDDAGRKFMQNRAMQQLQQPPTQPDDFMGDGMFPEVQAGSGGGTRLQRMMQQAEMMRGMRGPPGFEQKLAVPLEDDEEGDSEEG